MLYAECWLVLKLNLAVLVPLLAFQLTAYLLNIAVVENKVKIARNAWVKFYKSRFLLRHRPTHQSISFSLVKTKISIKPLRKNSVKKPLCKKHLHANVENNFFSSPFMLTLALHKRKSAWLRLPSRRHCDS